MVTGLSHVQEVLSKQINKDEIEETKRKGRRCKQVPNDSKETKIYLNLKKEAPDRSVWRTSFEKVRNRCMID
jgi:hypothetical protein